MSKENAIRFLMAKDKDEGLKSAFDTITVKYAGRNLSEDERDKMLQEEIIRLAKEYGFDFAPEDFKELQKTAPETLEDEELDRVAGGRGQIQQKTVYGTGGWTLIDTQYCDLAPDNQTFITRFNKWPDNGCPDYVFFHGCPNRVCISCKNFQVQHEEGVF